MTKSLESPFIIIIIWVGLILFRVTNKATCSKVCKSAETFKRRSVLKAHQYLACWVVIRRTLNLNYLWGQRSASDSMCPCGGNVEFFFQGSMENHGRVSSNNSPPAVSCFLFIPLQILASRFFPLFPKIPATSGTLGIRTLSLEPWNSPLSTTSLWVSTPLQPGELFYTWTRVRLMCISSWSSSSWMDSCRYMWIHSSHSRHPLSLN